MKIGKQIKDLKGTDLKTATKKLKEFKKKREKKRLEKLKEKHKQIKEDILTELNNNGGI